MIPSSLSQAKADPRLRGAPLAVYVWCLEHLDTQADRPVKVFELCVALRMKKRTAGGALDLLVEHRWIERTKRHGHGEAADKMALHYRQLCALKPERYEVFLAGNGYSHKLSDAVAYFQDAAPRPETGEPKP